MPADPRQWRIVIDGRVLTSFEELINLLHEAGFRVVPMPRTVVQLAPAQHAPAPDYRIHEEDDS